MKQKELTETFMTISNLTKIWSSWFIQKYFIVARVHTNMNGGHPASLM